MNKVNLGELNKKQISSVAVAYLIRNPKDVPKDLQKLFAKMGEYDQTMKSIIMALKEAQKTIEELQPKSDQLFGSINTLTEVIADMIPEEDLEKYAKNYSLPEDTPAPTSPPMTSEDNPKANATQNIDMAGSTAKKYSDENPVNLDQLENSQ